MFALNAGVLRQFAETAAETVLQRLHDEQRDAPPEKTISPRAMAKTLISLADVADEALRPPSQRRWISARKNGKVSLEAQGLALLRRGILQALEAQGVERIEPTGQVMDYTAYDPILVLPTNNPEQNGMVAETLRPGYRTQDGKVLRAAIVAVWKCEVQPSLTGKTKGA